MNENEQAKVRQPQSAHGKGNVDKTAKRIANASCGQKTYIAEYAVKE